MNPFRKKDRASWTLSQYIIYDGSNCTAENIQKKIDDGADVNGTYKSSFRNQSFLWWAANYGRTAALRVLIANGADPNADGDNTPLMQAIRSRRADCAEALVNGGANIHVRYYNNETALILATREGMGETVKLLLEKGADVNAQSSDGSTALHVAAEKGFANLAGLLMEKGADATLTNANLNTAADVAEKEYPGLAAVIRGKIPAPEPGTEATPDWQLLAPDEIAHVSMKEKIGYRVTEIFNFSARTYAHIATNLDSRAESQSLKSFAEIDAALVEKAHAELVVQGGSADPGLIKKKLQAPGL